MASALVMALLFGVVGLTAEVRHETLGWYSRINPDPKKREKYAKIDRFICYTIAIGFLIVGVATLL